MSTSNNKHLEKINDAIHNTNTLNDEEKSSSFKLIEEWIQEDKNFGTLYEKLMEISLEFEPIFIELGLI
jgi:hypothetical protein